MKMIGLAKKFEGLYHLIPKDKHEDAHAIKNSSVCTLPKSALFHFILVHISFTRVWYLPITFPFIVVSQKEACDICHYAKHKKLPYNSNITKSK